MKKWAYSIPVVAAIAGGVTLGWLWLSHGPAPPPQALAEAALPVPEPAAGPLQWVAAWASGAPVTVAQNTTRQVMPRLVELSRQPLYCAHKLDEIQVRGNRSVGTQVLMDESPVKPGQRFEMADGVKLIGHLALQYRVNEQPPPLISLDLSGTCAGKLLVRITEATPPPRQQGHYTSLLADVGPLLPTPPVLQQATQDAMVAVTPLFPRMGARTAQGGPTKTSVGRVPVFPAPPLPPVATPNPLQNSGPATPWFAEGPDTATSGTGTHGARPEDDLLILELMVNDRRVLAAFNAYMADEPNQAWLPLDVIVRAMGFPISVNAAAGTAEGWFVTESQTFTLNINAKTIQIGGKKLPFHADRVEAHDDDIYVHTTELAKWFPLTTKLDYNNLQLAITTSVALPEEEQLKRLAQWELLQRNQMLGRGIGISDATVLPYQWLAAPTVRVDAAVDAAYTKTGSQQFSHNGATTVQAEGDMLKGTGNLTLSFARDSASGDTRLNAANLRIQRREATPSLLGPLKATTVMAGDVDGLNLPLAENAAAGQGVRVNNAPSGYVDNPDNFQINGSAPVGWDVEVYQNQNLMAFAKVDGTGRYAFKARSLKNGLNTFRIVEYGKHGEKRERVERYYLGEGMLKPGQVVYDVATYQAGRNMLFNTQTTSATEPWAAIGKVDVGLTHNLSAAVGVQDNGTDNMATAGLRASYGPLYGKVDAMQSSDGQQAYGASVRSSIGQASDVRLGYITYRGQNVLRKPDKNVAEAEATTGLTVGAVGVNTGVGLKRTQYADGQLPQNEATHSLGVGYKRLSANNTLTHTWDKATSQTQGELELTASLMGAALRGSVNYQPAAQDGQLVKNVTLGTQVPVADDINLDTNLVYTPGNNESTALSTGLRKDIGRYAVGLNTRADTQGNYGVGVSLATMFVPNEDGYRQQHPSYSGAGRLHVGVYADKNANGKRDDDEPLLPNIGIYNRSRGTTHKTGEGKLALVDNLATFTPTAIEVDEETLPDIYLKAVKPRQVVFAHTGDNGTLEFPLQLYGEVNGTAAVLSEDGALRPADNLKLELVDDAGQVIDYAVTEYDGFYAMAPVPQGSYRVRLSPSDAQRIGYSLANPPYANVTAKHNVVEGVDAVILARPISPTVPQGLENSGAHVIQ